MLLPANAVCPTQHWLWSCLLHASQDPNRRTGTQWGCFRNNRGCLAYDAIAFRACTMRHVYLSPRVKKCWKRRENRGFCPRKSRVGGRRFLHTCKSGVARESFSGTAQYEHQHAGVPPLTLTDPVPSFCDFGDTNFQYPEVPWYPDPPAPDF